VSSGNHDGDSRNEADESVAEWLRSAGVEGLHVDGDSFDLGDVRITVCPWWDGELSRGDRRTCWRRESTKVKAGGRWIWIHHAPPEGSRPVWTGRKFIGDQYLRTWIHRFQPDMVPSGHIHNSPFYDAGSRIDRIGRTWVFNPGRQLGPEPTTIAIDLDAMTAEWTSIEDRSFRHLGVEA